MPSRGSLIWGSMAVETICRMRTASLRARAGSAIGSSSVQPGTFLGGAGRPCRRGPSRACERWGATGSLVGVADELPVGRQQRHLRSLGEQPLAGVEDVGHLTGL